MPQKYEIIKTCKNCWSEKPREEFPCSNRKSDTRRNICKICYNAAKRERLASDPHYRRKVNQATKNWRRKNTEHAAEYQKKYFQENKEHYRELARKYYQENPEFYAKKRRENYKKQFELGTRVTLKSGGRLIGKVIGENIPRVGILVKWQGVPTPTRIFKKYLKKIPENNNF